MPALALTSLTSKEDQNAAYKRLDTDLDIRLVYGRSLAVNLVSLTCSLLDCMSSQHLPYPWLVLEAAAFKRGWPCQKLESATEDQSSITYRKLCHAPAEHTCLAMQSLPSGSSLLSASWQNWRSCTRCQLSLTTQMTKISQTSQM